MVFFVDLAVHECSTIATNTDKVFISLNEAPSPPPRRQGKAYLTHSLLVTTVLRDRAMLKHLGDRVEYPN